MSIFVSVASYRDARCNNTIKSLYENAKFPENIYVGICQQNNNEDIDCLNDINYKHRIKIIRLKDYEAKGPCYARYICSKLYNNQDYYLQIDSHTVFVKDWDIKCIQMILQLKDNSIEKPVLSYYPLDDNDKNSSQYEVPRICKCKFDNDGMIILEGGVIINTDKKFYKTPFVTGGFLFMEGSALKDVPYQNNLDYLFMGEEILHSIRFFTSGYTIFTPNENIVYHYYIREGSPRFNKNINSDKDAINYIFNILNEKTIEGLGNQKTIQEFKDFAGIDFDKKNINKSFCDFDKLTKKNYYYLFKIIFILFICIILLHYLLNPLHHFQKLFYKLF